MLRSHRPRRGFTIIEVMIALGIFMMIILSIYSIWTGIIKATIAARAAADQAQRARISMRTVTDALNCAQMFTANMPPQNQSAYYAFIADMGQGDFGTLSFVAHLPATFPGVGRYGDHVVRRVTFSCEQGEGNTVNLVMRQGPMLQALSEDFSAYKLVLAKDVTMFGFECWGQPDPIRRPQEWGWVDKWESTNSLPSLMRIGLGLGQGKRKGDPQSLTVKVVALPAKSVQPEWQNPAGTPGGVPGQPTRPGQPSRVNSPGSINKQGGVPLR